jgi:hypothetical protein
MEAWQTVLAAILGNTVIVGTLAWLAKTFIESVSARDAKRFEQELRSFADQTIERLKSDLQLRTQEHEIKLSRLHEKRATVIAELNSLLAEAMWEAESLFAVMEWAGEPSKAEKYGKAMDKLVEFFRFFDKNRIYLPTELCDSLDLLVQDVRQHVIKFGSYVRLATREPLLGHTSEQMNEAWDNGWKALSDKFPRARRDLEEEFRRLLAPSAGT